MKCNCGAIVTINEKNFNLIKGEVVVMCQSCNCLYSESDFSEIELEKTYWSKLPSKSDIKK